MTAPAPTYSHRHNLAFSRFILPAERAPQAWKLLLGIVLILVIYALGIAQLVFGAVLITGTSADVFMSMIQVPKTPGTTYFVLATFIPLLIGIFTAAAVIHGRGPMSLICPPGKTLRHFGVAFGVMAVVLAVAGTASFLTAETIPNLSFPTWAMLLPLSLLGFLIQTGTEEILFRGYMQQQLAARYKSRVIWLLGPSLIFGLMHFSPTLPLPTVLYAIGAATLFGLIAADLTAQSGSIGPAWGMHFANNCFAALILAPRDTIEGLALFLTPYSMIDESSLSVGTVVVHATVLLSTWWVIRRLIRR